MSNKINLLIKAEKIANELHKGQIRKDGTTPYIKHCENVVKILKKIKIEDQNILASAWLHDVIEDCNVSKEYLEKEFNKEIANIVYKLTRNIDRDKYMERIKNSNYKVKIIKLADTLDNTRDLKMGYLSEKTIKRKLADTKKLYLKLAKSNSTYIYEGLLKNINLKSLE